MTDTLRIYERHDHFRIAWYLKEEGDFGLALGEMWSENEGKETRPHDDDDPEHWAAERAVAGAGLVEGKVEDEDEGVWKWETRASAQKALRVAIAAVKDIRANRIPEPWEALALAAGWKPPKRS